MWNVDKFGVIIPITLIETKNGTGAQGLYCNGLLLPWDNYF